MQQHTQAGSVFNSRAASNSDDVGSPFSHREHTHTNIITQNNKASYIVNNKYFAELMYSTKRTRKYCVSYTVRACPRLFFVWNCGLTRATVRNWLNSLRLVLSALEERWLVRSRTYSLFLRLCFWKVVKYLGRQVTFPYPSGHLSVENSHSTQHSNSCNAYTCVLLWGG